MQHRSIAFIGAGNMSRSIIGGLVKNGYPANHITAANPSTGKLEALAQDFSVNTTTDNAEAAQNADVIVLAVKPQLMADMLGSLTQSKVDLSNKLLVSIAAGIPIARLNEMLGGDAHNIVRTMPNTPSLLGLGLTGLFADIKVSQPDKTYAQQLMNAVGKTIWVETESGIDDIIAVAGSAPAYFFLFIEAIEQKALALGFSEQDARTIVNQVALGSAQLVNHSDAPLAELRANVTSKGGTTAKAIEHFESKALRQTTADAMQAAIERAQEMAKLF